MELKWSCWWMEWGYEIFREVFHLIFLVFILDQYHQYSPTVFEWTRYLKFFLIFFLDGEGNEIGCRRRSMGCHTSVTAVARMIQPLQRCHQAEPWADNGGQNFISAPKLDQVRPWPIKLATNGRQVMSPVWPEQVLCFSKKKKIYNPNPNSLVRLGPTFAINLLAPTYPRYGPIQ